MKFCLLCEGIAETERLRCSTCGALLVQAEEVLFPRRAGEEHSMNPWVGTLLDGKYRIQSVLGRGGMGTVFRATHEVAQAPVALKMLHPRLAQSRTYRQVFLAEARKASSIRHEGIARVQDVGETPEGVVYIAMELVEGMTLHDLAQRGPLPWPRAAFLCRQIAEGLAAAHAVQVVHQDLASRNVMVEVRAGHERVKILDFGISRAVGDRGREHDEAYAEGWANPPYSAPEHLRGEPIDARSDLYSLGVLLYEMLAGQPPYEAENREALIQRVLTEPPRPLPGRTAVPGWLQRMLEHLLERDPKRRYQSAGEVVRELDRRASRQLSKLVAMVMLVLAVALAAAAWSGARLRRITPVSGCALKLDRPDEVQRLTSRDLATLRFEVAGFEAAALRVELQSSVAAPAVAAGPASALDPEAFMEGRTLVLSDARAGWQGILAQLRASDTPTDLVLRTRDGLRLEAARLLVDDTPPEVQLEVLPLEKDSDGINPGVLALGRQARYRVHDDRSRAADIQLVLKPEVGDVRKFPLPWGDHTAALTALMPGVTQEMGPGELWLVAKDLAGNESRSGTIRFTRIDFVVPAITDVRGERSINPLLLTVQKNTVQLLLRVDREEEGLEVGFSGPDGVERQLRPVQRGGGTSLMIALPVGELGSGQAEERVYFFWVVDRAGNRSVKRQETLHLRTDAVGASFQPAVPAHVRVLEPGTFLTKEPELRLSYECNPVYRPARAQLFRRTAALAGNTDLLAPAAGHGEIVIHLPGEAGEFALRVEHTWEEAQLGQAPEATATVVFLPQPPRITVPRRAVQPGVFLRALRGETLVVSEGQPEDAFNYRLGPAFVLDCGSLLGARLFAFVEQGELWVPTELPLTRLGMQALERFDLRGAPGRNRVALQLTDGLGRPATVVDLEEKELETVDVPGGTAALVLQFRHEPRGPEPVDPVVPVEFQQRSTLVLVDPVAWQSGQADSIALVAGSGDALRPVRVAGSGSGSQLTFNLPFQWVAHACNWEHLSRREFLDQAERPGHVIAMQVQTPAGTWSVPVRFRPIRSNLQQVSLSDLWTGGAAAPDRVLGAMRFVPVLGNSGQETLLGLPRQVRVPGNVTVSHDLRVRDVPDCYLQDREVTRELYDRMLQELATGRSGIAGLRDPMALVHGQDPRSADRLTLAGMTPALQTFGADATWARVLAAAPQRPVTGVNYFQAYAFTRWLGLRVAGDPDRFRLPCAVELELAALRQPDLTGVNWNGCRQRPGLGVDGFTALITRSLRADQSLDPASWPLSAEEQAALGDLAETGMGRVHGVDFGVREWVCDFARPAEGEEGSGVLRIFLQIHESHLQKIEAYARDPAFAEHEPELAKANLSRGVLRGTTWGESPITGLTAPQLLAEVPGPEARGGFFKLVPGVVRSVHAARDGRGVFRNETDALVLVAGFRVAGGEGFVRAVRER